MKKTFQSKTIWFGTITAVLSALTFFQGEEWVKEYPQVAAGIGVGVGLLTVVLRFVTTKPLQLVKAKDTPYQDQTVD